MTQTAADLDDLRNLAIVQARSKGCTCADPDVQFFRSGGSGHWQVMIPAHARCEDERVPLSEHADAADLLDLATSLLRAASHMGRSNFDGDLDAAQALRQEALALLESASDSLEPGVVDRIR